MLATKNSILTRHCLPKRNRCFLRRSVFMFIALLCVLAIFNSPSNAQGPTNGSFVGVVRDNTGNGVPNAQITIKNQRNGFEVFTTSDQNGNFSKTALPPGRYEITVEARGFRSKTTTEELFATTPNEVLPPIVLESVVTPTPTPTPDITNPTQTPTPTPTPRVEDDDDDKEYSGFTFANPNITLNPRRDGVFNEFGIRSLPLGGTTLTRTFDELAFLVPGVAPPPQAIGNTVGPGVGGGVGTSGQFSVNGLRSRANNFTVDGSDNNDEDIGVRRQGFFTLVPQPIESTQEFTIITLLAPAEFGRNLGAQVNVNSKGGGNDFHGTLYGLGNADFLNARNFFDNDSGDRTFPLQARGVNGMLIDVLRREFLGVDDKGFSLYGPPTPLNVTNDAGEKDTFSLLQGGFAIGGPIVSNKLFFFASGEGQHQDGVRERQFAVPTIEQRGLFGTGATGLFQSVGQGNVRPIYPTSFAAEVVYNFFPLPNHPEGVYGPNTYTKALSVDARGVILSGRVDWNAFKINNNEQIFTARYNFTDDQRDLTDVGGALFSAIRPEVRTSNFSTYLTGGITNNVSNDFRFSWGQTRLRFEELRDDFLLPITDFGFGQQIAPGEDTRFILNTQITANFTIPSCPGNTPSCTLSQLQSPTFVDLRGDNRTTLNTDLGYVGQVIIGGFSPVGVDVFNFPQERKNDTFQFADTMRWQFGANGQHSFAFGTDIRRTSLDSDLPRNSRALLTSFGGRCVQDPTFCRTGFVQPLDLIASGVPTGFFQTLVLPDKDAAINLNYYQLNFFGQDEWRPTTNLTLNFGLRYEHNTTPKEADRKIEETFGIAPPSFLSDLSEFLEGRTSIYDSDRDNFAPRVGFAYSPNSKTVIRGGFGMYYDQILGAVVSQSRNVFPTFVTANLGGGSVVNRGYFNFFHPRDIIFDPTANDGNGLVCNLADYFNGVPDLCGENSVFFIQPGTLNTINRDLSQAQLQTILERLYFLFPQRCQGGTTSCSGSFGATLPKRELDTPLSYQYSIGVEFNLFRSTFLSAAYVGTTGRNLLRFTSPNLGSNYIAQDIQFIVDPLCSDDNPNRCQPQATGRTTSPTGPFAGIGTVNRFETTARSQYHSLQMELRGRLANRFQYRTNYVYGIVKDDVSDVFDLAGAFALPQDSRSGEFTGEYAPANFDVRHRFTYSFIYDSPGFRNQNNIVRYLIGGWQIAGTGRFNTGQPFTVNSVYDVNLDGNLTDRLNTRTGIEETGDRSQPLRLTTTNTLSLLADFGQDGSEPRNSFRTGNILELDMSFARRFTVHDEQNLEVRFDVFNFINRANFGVPVRILEFPSFGRATDTVTPGRRIQIMLRYNF